MTSKILIFYKNLYDYDIQIWILEKTNENIWLCNIKEFLWQKIVYYNTVNLQNNSYSYERIHAIDMLIICNALI